MSYRTPASALILAALSACSTSAPQTTAPELSRQAAAQSSRQQCIESLTSALEVAVYADYCVRDEQQRQPFFEFARRVATEEPIASCHLVITAREAASLRAQITAPYAANPTRHCAANRNNVRQFMRHGIISDPKVNRRPPEN